MVLKLPTVFTRIRFTNSVKKFGLAWRCIRGGQQGGLCYHHEIAFPLKSMAKRAMRYFAGADSTFGGCLGEDYARRDHVSGDIHCLKIRMLLLFTWAIARGAYLG